ncbi:MAG: putative alpha-mannosidase, partial [Acidobacteria bacterium]|nr:putative alpha-mannosidase [Acidobacteriota bacterium]
AFMNDTSVPQSAKDALAKYAGSTFLFSSGGITSAENLTLHTEAFIRNYLLGRQWLTETFGVTASNQMWIPDDFGHDAQLPALLQAMGFTGAGFWRIPAQAGAPSSSIGCVSAASTAASTFLDASIGLDFTWQANDGSQIQAHWLSNGYCEGNNIGDYSSSGFGGGTIPPSSGKTEIQSLITAQSTTAIPNPPYMFVPIDCDFTAPYTNLPTIVANWNANPGIPGVTVVMASFDHFMQLVAAAGAPPPVSPTSAAYPFIPHPYYSGCYGSKPLIKTTHYQTARTLLFTEAMQVVLQAIGNAAAPGALTQLAQAWNDLAPSTHHDYIPGTAPNTADPTKSPCAADGATDVYDDEQVPLLQQALAAAQAVQSDVLGAIAGALPAGDATVVVFNPLGFGRTAIADLASPPAGNFQSSTTDSQNFIPLQDDGNGGLLVQASPPSLGYTTITLSTTGANALTGLSGSQPVADGPVTMTNASISAIVDTTGITSLTTPNGTTNYLDAAAGLVFYEDQGNIYRFAMEIPCGGNYKFEPDASMTLGNPTITLTESGPLRTTAVVTGTIGGAPWTITYQLYATDTALRITVTGAAPSGYSVMWRFPFMTAATSLTYGTTSHWDTQSPRNFFDWTPPKGTDLMTFEPTHEFVAAIGMDSYLGAIYHYATPGWAIDTSGAVIGCLLRNTPGMQNAAWGIDPDAHTVSFAVALPVGLDSPGNGAWVSGSMLAAALDVNNPLAALTVPASATGALPSSMSIASTRDATALVTVAKVGTVDPSQLILRLYQPTNTSQSSVEVTLDPTVAAMYQSNGSLAASTVNALEQPSDPTTIVSTTATTVTVDLPFAITTVALG